MTYYHSIFNPVRSLELAHYNSTQTGMVARHVTKSKWDLMQQCLKSYDNNP